MQSVRINDEHELLDYLRPSKPHWCTPPICRNTWLYRGHAIAAWPLVASIYRNDVFKRAHIDRAADHLYGHLRKDDLAKGMSDEAVRRWTQIRLLIQAEYFQSGEFLRVADSLGLLEAGLVRVMTKEESKRWFEWHPTHEPVEPDDGVALAQHHRIPTRLLDWTTSGLGAAWFAASDAQVRLINGEDIAECAIWAVSMFSFGDERIRLIRPKRGANPYLRAQAGAFTWDRDADAEYIETGKMTFQESFLDNLCYGTTRQGLVKITFPASIAGDLCELLYIEGFTKARMMPTLDNVAEVINPAWLPKVL